MLPVETQNTEKVRTAAPQKKSLSIRIACGFLSALLAVGCVLATGVGVYRLAVSAGVQSVHNQSKASDVAIMDKYDMIITNKVADALDGVAAIDIKRVYWLSDKDLIAPRPNPANYGEVDRPEELAWLLEEAAELIDGQEMLFSLDTPVWEKEKIRYYYDETILVITWKQIIERSVFTISEIKIAHPSQFRRFLAGGEYASDKQYITTEMAQNVNAVVASSGDFYNFRRVGVSVYEGKVQRVNGKYVDTCFINEDGDLLFAYKGEMLTEEDANKFVEDNRVRFSLTFGPVLIDDGVACPPKGYTLGEIDRSCSRAAVCQMDKLHYVLTNVCGDGGYKKRQTVAGFAKILESFGCQRAYALDGGQTTVIAMDGELISNPDYGWQRQISDIIYFATALPEE